MAAQPTVFVVDDDAAVRDSLKTLFSTSSLNVTVYDTIQAFFNDFNPDRPGCLLLDACVPGITGLKLPQQIKDEHGSFSVIITTAYSDIPSGIAAMKAGTVDIVEKPFNGRDLLCRIRDAIRRDADEREQQVNRIESAKRLATLTAREREVLELVVQGKPTKVIAAKLGSSFNTVRNQRCSILKKMKVESAVNLARMITEMRNQ